MNCNERDELARKFADIASMAGELIMASRKSDVRINVKGDGSPVTGADLEAEHLIRGQLAAIMPEVAVIAEESFEAGTHGPAPERFLLVDPLDGTREFVSGSAEFTVNIALVERGEPVVGTIYAPALKDLYLAGATAYRVELEPGMVVPAVAALQPIRTSPVPEAGMRAVGSRSHMDAATKQWLSGHPIAELRSAGSSLKFCLIASGDADVYPRLAPTMEWDTAAGHAIVSAAGGCVLALDGAPLRYGKTAEGYKNHGFVAWGRNPVRGEGMH